MLGAWRPALTVRPTPSSTPSPIFLSPILSWLERPCWSPEPPRGPPKDPLGLRQRHHHLPGSKQDPKTQADISFTKSSRASWPPLLRNQMPGNSGWPAKSPCLRGAGLADMCLCPSGLQSPTSPPARGHPGTARPVPAAPSARLGKPAPAAGGEGREGVLQGLFSTCCWGDT